MKKKSTKKNNGFFPKKPVKKINGFIEYTNTAKRFRPIDPERRRKFSNQVIKRRVYCYHDGCKKYIRGTEGYNGGFTAETGQSADLRNQVWYCGEHVKEVKKLERNLVKARAKAITKLLHGGR